MARIAAEVHKDHTFHPKVRASLPPVAGDTGRALSRMMPLITSM